MEIEEFILHIPNFNQLSAASLVKYFTYFCQVNRGLEVVRPIDILNCFTELHINAYSNIPSYMSKHAQKKNSQEFLKRGLGYILLMDVRKIIENEVSSRILAAPTDSLYPLDIFKDTRGYLIKYAEEASLCYDYHLYNSCLFMLRKISEIIVVDLFERNNLANSIKKGNGDYFQLGDLIKALISESSWRLSKIIRENFPKIKLLGDSSVHSKRFNAKKPDIDHMKLDIRIAFEELIALVDYPNWKSV